MNKFSDFGIRPNINAFKGEKIKIERILNKEIIVHDFEISKSKFDGQLLSLQIELSGEKRVIFTGSKVLTEMVQRIQKSDFPFSTTITKDNEYYEFT